MPVSLHRENSILVDRFGNHFSGLLPTCFLACSPNYPWEYTKSKIDNYKLNGAAGIRAAIGVCWGPQHVCEHGGNTNFWGYYAIDLRSRIEQVLNYLRQNSMFLILETGVGDSTYLMMREGDLDDYDGDVDAWNDTGHANFVAQSQDWIDLFNYLITLNHNYSNLIIGTGNEPSKGEWLDLVILWQSWCVQYFKTHSSGDNLLLQVDVTPGTGVPELINNPYVDIVSVGTSRTEDYNLAVVGAYNALIDLQNRAPKKVHYFQEPPRRMVEIPGDRPESWLTPTAKNWLRTLHYINGIGALFTPHGLSNGEEEEQPPNGRFLWGFGQNDYADLWEPRNRLFDLLTFNDSTGITRTLNDFKAGGGGSWITSNGIVFPFKSISKETYVAWSHSNKVTLDLGGQSGERIIFDPVLGVVESSETVENLDGMVLNVLDKIIIIKISDAPPPNPPVILSCSPATGQAGTSLSVTLLGESFQDGLLSNFGAGITVSGTHYASPSQATANITISSLATLGVRSVTVTNPDGGTDTLENAFTVTESGGIEPPPGGGTGGTGTSNESDTQRDADSQSSGQSYADQGIKGGTSGVDFSGELSLDKIAIVGSAYQSDIQTEFENIIKPIARAVVMAVSIIQAGKLKSVGGSISPLEIVNKADLMTKLILTKYVAAIIAGINTVMTVQSIKELDRDRLTPQLTIEVLKPQIEAILTRNLENLDFGKPKGILAELIKQIKKLGTKQFVDVVMGMMP